MEDPAVDDEKKPFDVEAGLGADEDAQPDPDEQLMLDQGNGRVWLVKIPRYLMERWSAIDAEDVHLATIRVYHPTQNATPNNSQTTEPSTPASTPTPQSTKPRIVLFLPPSKPSVNPDPSKPTFAASAIAAATSTNGEVHPEVYELDMINDSVDNQIVVAERPKDPYPQSTATANTANSRARTTILTGRIKHDCNLRPVYNASYRAQMRERSVRYNTPVRSIIWADDTNIGGRGAINKLSSGAGVGPGGTFGDLIKSKRKHAKGTFERMARMPRNQLLDMLFSLFRDTPRWGVRPLRERTQQPEAYLKEVLSEVAILHRAGEWNGLWELKEAFRDGASGDGSAVALGLGHHEGDFKMEVDGGDEGDDDDDEDDDMEEVS